MIRNTVQLGSIAEFRNGVNYNKNNFGNGIKVINVADFKDYFKPKYEELGEINPEGVVSDDSVLKKNDIIFVRSNGNKELIGRTLFIDEDEEDIIYSAFCIRCRFIDQEVEPKFYAYLFKTNFIRSILAAQGNGTNISNLNQGILNKLQVPKPPKDIQKKIIKFLSRYDDLIENNNKRIKLLEESIKLIYNEYFIKFNFKDSNKGDFIDGLPSGWSKKSVLKSNYFNLIKDNIKRFDGIKRYYATADIEGIDFVNEGEEISWDSKPSRAQKQPVINSVWVARMKDAYKVIGFSKINEDIGKDCVLSSGFVGLQAKDELCFALLFSLINSDGFLMQRDNFATGSTQISLNNDGLSYIEYIEPSKDVMESYGKVTLPMINNIFLLQRYNRQLKEARDILIPKLIKGEIEV